MTDNVVGRKISLFFFFVCVCVCFFVLFLFKIESRGHNSLIVPSVEITASLIQVLQLRHPISNDLKQNNAIICDRDVLKNETRTNYCVM